jgi:hypothetical protein
MTCRAVINSLFANISRASFGFDPFAYAGAKVLLIEGQPAWEYMREWASTNAGVFHTEGQKVNFAYARSVPNGLSWGAFGLRDYNPRKDYINVSIVGYDGSRLSHPECTACEA